MAMEYPLFCCAMVTQLSLVGYCLFLNNLKALMFLPGLVNPVANIALRA